MSDDRCESELTIDHDHTHRCCLPKGHTSWHANTPENEPGLAWGGKAP